MPVAGFNSETGADPSRMSNPMIHEIRYEHVPILLMNLILAGEESLSKTVSVLSMLDLR